MGELAIQGTTNIIRGPAPFEMKRQAQSKNDTGYNMNIMDKNSALPPV